MTGSGGSEVLPVIGGVRAELAPLRGLAEQAPPGAWRRKRMKTVFHGP